MKVGTAMSATEKPQERTKARPSSTPAIPAGAQSLGVVGRQVCGVLAGEDSAVDLREQRSQFVQDGGTVVRPKRTGCGFVGEAQFGFTV